MQIEQGGVPHCPTKDERVVRLQLIGIAGEFTSPLLSSLLARLI